MDLDRERSRWWSGSKKDWALRDGERRKNNHQGRWERKTDGDRGKRGGEGREVVSLLLLLRFCCRGTAVYCSTAWRSKPEGTCAPWELCWMQSQRWWRGGWGGLGVRDDGGSRREAAETGGETAGGRAAKQNTFKKLKDPKVHLWNAPCEERRHANDQIIRGTRLL